MAALATLEMANRSDIPEQLQEHWQAWLARHEGANGLKHADRVSMEKIADAAGIEMANTHEAAANGTQNAAEMPFMMQALNIDPTNVETSDPEGFQAMQAACATCANKGGCRTDLNDGTAPEHYLFYCNNADILNALRADPEMLAP